MFTETPQQVSQELSQGLSLFVLLLVLFCFLMVAIVSAVRARHRTTSRAFRDDGIRALEARLHAAKCDTEKSRNDLVRLEEELKEAKMTLVRRDNVITEQQYKIEKIQSDLKYSVIKTRELRAELAERATEIIHAEVKIREVEAELSVAHASTDMIASDIRDYHIVQDRDEEEQLGLSYRPDSVRVRGPKRTQ